MKIAVLGAGAWGTAFAASLCQKHRVTLWARDTEQITAMRTMPELADIFAQVERENAMNLFPRFK